MHWLASFAAALIQKLGPWFYELGAKLVQKIANYFAEKKNAEQRKKASEKVDEAIQNKSPREERQKHEESELNS